MSDFRIFVENADKQAKNKSWEHKKKKFNNSNKSKSASELLIKRN